MKNFNSFRLKTSIFALFLLFNFEISSQNIDLSFPNGVNVCSSTIELRVEITNDTGTDIDNGTISLDLTGTTGLSYNGNLNQLSGPVLTETVIGVPSFDFTNTFVDSDVILFTIDLALDCSGLPLGATNIDLSFNFESGGVMMSSMQSLSGFSVESPDIDIISSAPIGVSGVIGHEFEVTNIVENNGTSEADSVFYCVELNTNASLDRIEVGGSIVMPSINSIPGFTCFNIGNLVDGANVSVIEYWEITSCNTPIQNLFRKATYGCDGSLDCAMDPDSEFPSTVLTLIAPIDPITITTSNVSELFVCGPTDQICITIENDNGDDFILRNVKSLISMPVGVSIDYSTLTMKTGDPVTLIPATDSLLIGDLEDGESVSFTLELSILCDVIESAVDYTVDVVYDELCEGAISSVTEVSSQISVLAAEFSILSPLIQGNLRPMENVFDAILGVPDTIKVPLVNAGSGSIDSFTYFVVNPSSVNNVDVLIDGVSLQPLGMNGDTVFYAITSPDILRDHTTGGGSGNGDGQLDENESLLICEVWIGVQCEFGSPDPIRRGARYGCGGIEVCHESNMSTTGVDFGFAIADLVYSEYDPLVVRPACYSETPTTLAIEVINEGNSIAKDIFISINQGSRPGAIIGSSLMYGSLPGGPFASAEAIDTTSATGSLGSNGQCVTGAGYYRSADAFLEDVNLAPGDTLYFTYMVEFGCDCRACNIDNIYGSTITSISWNDPCDIELVNNADVSFRDFDANLQGFFEGESNVNSSGCFTYQITSGFSTWMGGDFTSDYPDAYFESRLNVGCGLDVTTAQIINNSGVPVSGLTIVENLDGGVGADDEVIFRIDRNVSGTIEICFDLDCSEKPGGCVQNTSVSMENFFFPDPSCAPLCEPNVSCESTINFVTTCPGCMPCDGMRTVDLEVNRTNYCFLDADNDFVADDGSLADATTAKGKRFVQGDSLKLTISGVVSDEDGPVTTWDYAFLELDLQTANFVIIGAEFSVFDASSSTTLTCNSLSQFPLGDLLVTDLSVPSMTGLGCADFNSFEYADGDSLFLCVYYSPKEPLNNVQSEQIEVAPDFYLSDSPYDTGSRFQCNQLIETLNQIGIRTNETVNIGGRDFGGCDLSPFDIRYDLNYGSLNFDEFCNEIRSPGIPQKFTFVKPPELEYSLADFGFAMYQRIGPDDLIVNDISGGIPASFFVESGDTLCFFVKDYLASLNDDEISEKGTDGGYSVVFYPGIRGNCLSEIMSYEACASLTSDVDNQVFCQDTIQTNLACEEFDYTGGPVLIASSSSTEIELFEPLSCVTIDLDNISNINAPFSWLNIDAITGGLVVSSVTEVTGGMSTLITPSNFGVYQLGFTNSGSSRSFEICVNVTNCDPQTLSFTAGWDCSEYPATVQEATCIEPSEIDFISVESAYTGQLIKPVTDSEYDLCDTICFVHRFSSTALGNINDIVFDFITPLGTEYVPGSFEIAYPVPPSSSAPGDTIWTHVVDPSVVVDRRFRSNVTELNSTLDSLGLIGSLGALENLNIILVRWNLVTTCDFISGSRGAFITRADDLCGDALPVLRSRSPRFRIKDVFPSYEIDLMSNDLTLNPCNSDDATIGIELEIDADPGVMTSVSDTIKITLPQGMSYIDMTYNPLNNATANQPEEMTVNGTQCLMIPIVPGLVDGDLVAFEIDIVANDVGQACGNYEMVIQTFSSTNASCNGDICSIGVLSGEDLININIQKPDLSVITTDINLISMPPANASLEYEIKIMNNGAVPLESTSDLVVEFWNDVDDNGLLDTLIDTKVVEAINNVLINTGSMQLVSGTVPIPPTGICNALAVINPSSSCVCNLSVSNQTKVNIQNDFDLAVSVCSNEIFPIGPQPVAGFDYEWLSVDGSNLAALSSTSATQVDFQFANTTGADIVWQYAIRSSFEECFSYDTMQVTVFPELMSEASTPGCEGATVVLPGPVTGSNFLWTPATNLDDATLSMPTVDPVVTGNTIYNLSYIDENGCGASKMVTVIGAACAPGTALGDTLWFDVNENGLQDLLEPPVPNVVVYLYNSTNTTSGNHIAVTTSDANGYYIFDNLVAGNYVVEFEMPDGFIFTSQDNPTDDANDSDADPSTGLTESYFLPNGTFNPTIDGGFIPDCSLDVSISDVSDCLFNGNSHTREVLVDIDWSNAVYTYDFLGGVDTIELNILGQTFEYEIDALSGDTTQLVILSTSDTTDIIAEVFLRLDNDCIESDTVLNTIPCIYDVALIKEVSGFGPFSYGDILTFNITVANQGAQAVNNVKINDFLPSGFVFDPVLNPDWMQSSPDTLMYIIDDILQGSETRIIPLNLELVMSSEPNAYLNTSEIFSFTDTLGMERSMEDIDSSPDNNPNNDAGGNVNTGSDNSLDGDGTGSPGDTNPNTDEDDQDPELIRIVDLALTKDILTPGPYDYGDTVEFEITVFNQGNVIAQNIKVNDFIPNGFAWDMSNEPNWELMGNIAMDTIPGPINTGESVSTTISLIVQMANADEYVNIAEIGYFEDENGSDITDDDIDSNADNDPINDGGGNPGTDSDGSINGNGTGSYLDTNADTDEDDNDPAYISIPQINLEKSTISVVPAQSGIPGNFDATYEFVISNTGNEKLTCIQLQDDLTEQLGGTYVGITSPPVIVPMTNASLNPILSMGYNGGVIDTIFNGTSGCLNPSELITVQMTIELNAQTGPDPIINEGDVSGKSPNGILVMDSDTAVVEAPDCFLETICPIDQVTLECINDIPASGSTVAWFNGVDGVSSVVNSCGIPTIIVNDTNNGGTGCLASPYVLTRQIIINDPGDGSSTPESDTCEVIYTVIDDIKPIVMNAPLDLILQCGVDNSMAISDWITDGDGMFIDGCGIVNVTSVVADVTNQCGTSSTTEYIFTATDACGNSVTETANIITIDTTAPTLILPAGASMVSCEASPDADAWAATAMATDDCDPAPSVDFALINVVETCNGTSQQTIYSYRFTAVDACGNVSMEMFADYIIIDSVMPSLTPPADLSITCGQDISLLVAEWLGNITSNDNCDASSELTVSNDFDATMIMNACGATIPVIWTVTDNCNGMSTATANIVIADDNEGPTMTCEGTLTYNIDVGTCGALINLPLPLAIDCNGVDSVKQISPAIDFEFPIGMTTVMFQSWDACGNSTMCETIVEVIDTQNPELICPPSINQCTDIGECFWTADATVNPITSDCGSTTLTYLVTSQDGSTDQPTTLSGYQFNLGSNSVTITASDNVMPPNTTTCNFNVNVTDCESPIISNCPMPQTSVECGSEDVNSWIGDLEGMDNCDMSLNEDAFLISQENNCGNTSSSIYLFVVTDDSGNSSSCTSTYTIIDTDGPTINTESSNPIETCSENSNSDFLAWLSANGGASATDDCTNIITWTNDWDGTIPNGCSGSTTVLVTFTATDACGNTSTSDGLYSILDSTEPSLMMPQNLTLECGNPNNLAVALNWLNTASGADNCSNVEVTNNFTALPLTCNTPVTIEFTATDNCMNMTTGTRTITLSDITNPVIVNAPSDLIVECGLNNTIIINDWINNNGGGSATDNCGTPTVTFAAGGPISMCGTSSTTEYIFTATDPCGNTTIERANLITIDTTDPELTLPPGTSIVSCEASPDPDAWAATATVIDSCDVSPTVNYVLTNIAESCSGATQQTIYTYAFTGVDACGNISEVMTADYIVTDSSVPSLAAPTDLSITCGQDISLLVTEWLDDVVASDNCDDVSELIISNDFDASMLMNACGATIPVTWTVTDNCGGTNTAVSNIVIASDSEGPEMVCESMLTFNIDVNECGALLNLPLPQATDCNGVDSIQQISPADL